MSAVQPHDFSNPYGSRSADSIQPADVAGRGQRSALFSSADLALKARGAKDWRTRLALSLTHSGRFHFIEYHHIFPKATLKGRYEKSEINEMANMAFVSGARIGEWEAHRPSGPWRS